MDTVTWLLYRRESRVDLLREKHLRPYGRDTAHALVRRGTGAAGSDAGGAEPNGAGIAVHYGLVNDLLAARLLGIAGPQGRYPWQAHARGLIGHVVLGVVTEATLNAIEVDTAGQAP